jgi:hypothetical protein
MPDMEGRGAAVPEAREWRCEGSVVRVVDLAVTDEPFVAARVLGLGGLIFEGVIVVVAVGRVVALGVTCAVAGKGVFCDVELPNTDCAVSNLGSGTAVGMLGSIFKIPTPSLTMLPAPCTRQNSHKDDAYTRIDRQRGRTLGLSTLCQSRDPIFHRRHRSVPLQRR